MTCRKFVYGLLFFGTLLHSNTYATETHEPTSGISIDYELAANDPQEFANPLFWSVTATCTVTTQDPINEIYAEILKRSVKINGITLNQGDSISIPLHNGDHFVIVADSGSKARLTNLGPHSILTTCSV